MTSLLVLAQVLAFGHVALRLSRTAALLDVWSRLGWSILLGQLALGFLTAAVLTLGAGWDVARLLAAGVIVVAAADVTRSALRRVRGASSLEPTTAPTRTNWICVACALLALGLTTWLIATSRCELLTRGDEAGIWAAKAKAIWHAGSLAPTALQPELGAVTHADYPALNPLLQVWSFAQDGHIQHAQNRLPIQLALPAIVLLLMGGFRRRGTGALGGVLLLALVTTRPYQFAAGVAMSDGLVALGLLATLEALHAQRTSGDARWLRLAVGGSVLLVASKNEGWMLALVAFGAWFGLPDRGPRRVRWGALLAAAPALGVVLVQIAHNRALGVGNDMLRSASGDGPVQRLVGSAAEHAGVVFESLAELTLLSPSESHFLFPAALLLLIVSRPWSRAARSLHGVTLALGLAGFVLVYLQSPRDVEWHVRTSMPRLLFQLLPLLVAWIGILLVDLRRETPAAD